MKLATNNHFFLVKEESIQDNKLATVGEREYKICLSDNLVLGSNQDFYYISAENPKLYSFKKINKTTFDSLTDEEDANQTLIAAFSRVLYSLGEFYDARDCLIRTNDRILISRFKEATSTKEVIVAIDHLDAFLLKRKPTIPFVKNPGQLPSCDLFTLFEEMVKAKAMVDIVQLHKIYQRKSPSKKYGSLNDQGEFIPCKYETRSTTKEWAYLVNADFTNNGDFNISLKENVELYDKETDTPIKEVSGIKLNIQSYKSYNLYDVQGCRIKTLLIRVDNKYLDEFESKTGLNYDFFEEGTHTDHFMFEINIEDIPILNKDIYANTDSSNPRTLISLVIVTDFLRGILKDNTVCSYTQEQIDELKKYHITPSMNFSPPSISDSKSDVESYKVDFGSKSLNVLSNKFKSGNFYLDRRFSIPGIEKLSLPLLLENDIRTLELKVLSARAKEDEAEKLVIDTYKYLFNMSENKGLVGESLDYQLDALKDALNSKDTLRLKNLQSLLSKQLDTLYKTSFLPIIIGLRLNRIAYEGLNIKFTLDLDNSDYLIDIKP